MSLQLAFFAYAALLLALAVLVRMEGKRRRKGADFKPGELGDLHKVSQLRYSPPLHRPGRSFDRRR
jgi:hypothetical protein